MTTTTSAPATPGDGTAPDDTVAAAPATPGVGTAPDDTVAAAPATPGDSNAHGTSTGISNTKLAMWVFLGSECLLFGGLISTYLLYKTRRGPDNRAIPTDVFDIPFTSISSFVLLMSSLTMVLALSALIRGDNHGLRVWLLATSMLGGVFIGGQVYEFTSFLREGVGLTNNPASSAFYALTGFHGVHVSLGIVMLMSLVVASWQGKLRPEHSETVEVVGLYWHFVDVVWIFIFTVIYLVPA